MFNIKYEDPDLLVLIDWIDGNPVLHHHVYHWKLSVHKKMIEEFNRIVAELKEDGHDELYSYYHKDNASVKKFCDRYGFYELCKVDDLIYVVKDI